MPARFLDERADGYRSTYWVVPPKDTMGGASANAQERTRTEKLGKLDLGASQPTVRFTGTTTVTRPWTPTNPLDSKAYARSSTVQNWLGDTGSRRSLPTNIIDEPSTIHVNAIKSDKITYIEPHAWGTGRIYSSKVCEDNWVEERNDPSFAPDVLPKELQNNKTEYTSSLGATALMAVGGGTGRLNDPRATMTMTSSLGGTARILKQSNPVGGRPLNENRGAEVMYYSKEGYGSGPRQDHTVKNKRGAFWVGTTPFKPYESSTTTQQIQEKFEYQKRHVANDPIALVFSSNKQDPELLAKTNDRFSQSQKLSTSWKTRYQSDFANFHGHKAAPQLGPTAAEASLIAERTARLGVSSA